MALGSKSAARDEGVKEAMIMTHVNKVDILGMPQEEILELLKRQVGTVRHIRFTSLAGSSPIILGSELEGEEEKDMMSSKSTPALLANPGKANAKAAPTVDVTKLSGFPSVLDQQGRLKKPSSTSPSKLARLANLDGGVLDSQALAANFNSSSSSGSSKAGAAAADDWETALHTRPANSSIKNAAPQRIIAPGTSAPLTAQHYIGSRGMMVPAAAKPVLPQPGADPFSTPARRRRIVADVSRFLLKQYCVKACDNVIYLRKANKAAIRIQCLWRCYRSKKKLSRLRFCRQMRAAEKIQRLARVFLARRELARRRAAHLYKISLHLALHLQHFWRARRLRRRQLRDQARERSALIAYRQGKKFKAAIQIEKGARGMLARIRARKLRKLQLLHNLSATKIQTMARRHSAQRRRRALRAAYRTIGMKVYMWWLRRKWERGMTARRMQRVVRGGLARLRCRRLREAIEIARLAAIAQEEKRKQEIKFQLAVSAATSKAEEEAALKMQLFTRVDMRMLRHLAAMGPQETVAWALSCGLVRFQSTVGFSLGDATLQAIGVVNTCYPKLKLHTPKGAGEGLYDGEESKEVLGITHITDRTPDGVPLPKPIAHIDSWRTINGAADKPSEENLPLRWAQVVGISRRAHGNGVELSVARDQRGIQIIMQIRASKHTVKALTVDVVSPLTLSATAPVKFIPVTTVCIVLEGLEREVDDVAPIITPASGIIRVNDCPIRMFEFQGVCVSLPQEEVEEKEEKEVEPKPVEPPPEPEPLPEPEPEPESEAEEEIESFGSMDDDIESVPDFDSFACIIQFAYRRHLRPRILAVMLIQQQWRRVKTLSTWYNLVEAVWQRAVKAVQMIQHCGLAFVSRKRVAYRRDDAIYHLYSEFEHLKGVILQGAENGTAFLRDEDENWLAFGMTKPLNLPQDIRGLPQFQGQGQRREENGGSYVLGEAGFDVYDESQVIDTNAALRSQTDEDSARAGSTAVPVANGVLMYSAASTFSQAAVKSVWSQMLRAVQLPEAQGECVHPLCELTMSSAVLGEPWNVYSDAELGVVLPALPEDGEEEEDEHAKAPLPPVYTHVAAKSFTYR